MSLAMKVLFNQTTRCHTATGHVLAEVLLLLYAVLIIYDPEEVDGYSPPGLLVSSVLFVSHYSPLSLRPYHFIQLFLSASCSVYLSSFVFRFYLALKTDHYFFFSYVLFSFPFSIVFSCFLYFFLSHSLSLLNFSFSLFPSPGYIFSLLIYFTLLHPLFLTFLSFPRIHSSFLPLNTSLYSPSPLYFQLPNCEQTVKPSTITLLLLRYQLCLKQELLPTNKIQYDLTITAAWFGLYVKTGFILNCRPLRHGWWHIDRSRFNRNQECNSAVSASNMFVQS